MTFLHKPKMREREESIFKTPTFEVLNVIPLQVY